ncbi:MAG: DUF1345 domain-containing protein [Actinobacteria bacterium]|nr:DUF1345 domain-containing protein [Actinomycetota bacterium]
MRSEKNPQSPRHWQLRHEGEHRWPVAVVVILVIALQFSLDKSLSLSFKNEICIIEAALLMIVIAINPKRISSHIPSARFTGIVLTWLMTLSNSVSAVKLIDAMISGDITDAPHLLISAGSIWITNVVVFALWYWELDRGGPGKRAEALKPYPDFMFPQMSDPNYAPPSWHPNFFDYLYTSFTNASAFSPTDVMPLTRWAKMLMLVQSFTALLTVGLVIARAVNILH